LWPSCAAKRERQPTRRKVCRGAKRLLTEGVEKLVEGIPSQLIVLPDPQKPRSNHFILSSPFRPSIGHGFGGIPAPGNFGSSAFPFPPKNSSQTRSKTFCAPPEMQTLALAADPSRFRVPQLQGQKWRPKRSTKIESNLWAFWARTRKANPQRRRGGRSLSSRWPQRPGGRARTSNANKKPSGTASLLYGIRTRVNSMVRSPSASSLDALYGKVSKCAR
jgi:hypothetical protein